MTSRSSRAGHLALGGEHLVLDPQAALEVEAQLRLERCGPRVVPTDGRGTAHEAQHEGEQANDDDQDRGGATHRGGMIQGTADPRGADRRAAARPGSPGARVVTRVRPRASRGGPDQAAGCGPPVIPVTPERGPRKCVNR